MKKHCLNCKFFKLVDVEGGGCRKVVTGEENGRKTYKRVGVDDFCEQWVDGGQQYFIRQGWIESEKKKLAGQGQ